MVLGAKKNISARRCCQAASDSARAYFENFEEVKNAMRIEEAIAVEMKKEWMQQTTAYKLTHMSRGLQSEGIGSVSASTCVPDLHRDNLKRHVFLKSPTRQQQQQNDEKIQGVPGFQESQRRNSGTQMTLGRTHRTLGRTQMTLGRTHRTLGRTHRTRIDHHDSDSDSGTKAKISAFAQHNEEYKTLVTNIVSSEKMYPSLLAAARTYLDNEHGKKSSQTGNAVNAAQAARKKKGLRDGVALLGSVLIPNFGKDSSLQQNQQNPQNQRHKHHHRLLLRYMRSGLPILLSKKNEEFKPIALLENLAPPSALSAMKLNNNSYTVNPEFVILVCIFVDILRGISSASLRKNAIEDFYQRLEFNDVDSDALKRMTNSQYEDEGEKKGIDKVQNLTEEQRQLLMEFRKFKQMSWEELSQLLGIQQHPKGSQEKRDALQEENAIGEDTPKNTLKGVEEGERLIQGRGGVDRDEDISNDDISYD